MSSAEMPLPLGVIAETGETRPPLNEADVKLMNEDPDLVRKRKHPDNVLGFDSSVDDPADLSQTGWAILFADDADPLIEEALQPLINWRKEQVCPKEQVGSCRLWKVFKGLAGVRKNQTASAWASSKGVSLVAPVNPAKGVPYYLLIVGSPQRIPFEFQFQFDLQWAVGRLHFDKIDDYASYAKKVVEYEKGSAPPQTKHAAIWMPRNKGDIATGLLSGAVGPDFLGKVGDETPPLGHRQKFRLSTFIGDGAATKDKLGSIVRGEIDGGPPSILFTGSHGAEWSIDTPDLQRQRQGALVTQEWSRGEPLTENNCFQAEDVTSAAKLHGAMAFVFSCFGGGCPANDSYRFNPDRSKIPVAPEPLIAALPQALLREGALAVIAHIDRAFTYGFEDVTGTPQVQLFRTPLELLMKGKPVGFASDPFNLQWSALAAILGMALGGNLPGNPQPSSAMLGNLFIARDDARNYLVLGDPATRLNVDRMAPAQ